MLLLLVALCTCIPFATAEEPGSVDQVTELPGLTFKPNFKHYSGYLNANDKGTKLHYWFVESQRSPSSDPLVLWLNGGPGCSSLTGLLKENGPFRLNVAGDKLHENVYAWNKVANVIYLESPAGVGFSYDERFRSGNVTTGDNETAENNYNALVDWFRKFPSYANRSFFLTGESYAGVYVPTLAAYIAQHMHGFPGHLAGIMVGNGLYDKSLNEITAFLFLYNHGIFGNQRLDDDSAPSYLLSDVVRQALHIPEFVPKYQTCNYFIFENYTQEYNNMRETFQVINGADIRILLYNGDVDAVCNFMGVQCFVESLAWKVTQPWQPWRFAGDVVSIAGYFQGFEGLDFVTVRGAGHFVPAAKPREALQLLANFINGITIWHCRSFNEEGHDGGDVDSEDGMWAQLRLTAGWMSAGGPRSSRQMRLSLLLALPALTLGAGELDTRKISFAGDYEKLLYSQLLSEYNPLVRPVDKEGEPINVTLGLDLQQIVDIDEKNQVIITNVWMKYLWRDIYLQWDPKTYGNVSEVRLPISRIWKPDILLYNSADPSFDSLYSSNAIVYSDGSINWIPPGIITSSCKINIEWFPFDDQICTLKFGSWTYSGFQINLLQGLAETATYTTNGEWNLMGTPVVRNVMKYDCCPDPYIDVTFTIWVRRRTLYYTLNLLIPCVLMSSMTLFAFTLPPDSGEKLTLVVTIFMSLCVTMLMVAEAMPQTSDAVPRVSLYFSSLMVVVAIAICFTILVLNWHHRSPDTHDMSDLFRRTFVHWLPRMLCMKPYRSTLAECPEHNGYNPPNYANTVVRDKSSRSLLANVLDMDISESFSYDLQHGIKPRQEEKNGGIHLGGDMGSCCNCGSVVRELRKMTAKIREDEEEAAAIGEWQYAANAIDRASLFICTGILVGSTAIFVISAPYLYC